MRRGDMRLGASARAAAATLLLVLVSGAVPAAAQTENWRPSSRGGVARGYIETNSISRDGDIVRFWREIRFPSSRMLGSDVTYDRLAALYEGDCRGETLRPLSVRARLGERIVWKDEEAGEADRVERGSAGYVDLRAACFNEWPAP
jgi:hypothetical protein